MTLGVPREAVEQAVADVYAGADRALDNTALYRRVAERIGVQMELFERAEPVGRKRTRHVTAARTVRWAQQSLRLRGLLERVDRGVWRMTAEGRKQLRRPIRPMRLLAFSTDLGMGVWGDCRDVLGCLDDEITLALTSPPYPLRKERAYGNVAEARYVDWLCSVIEHVVPKLTAGGNLVLVVSNDVFEEGLPSRSLYKERLILALADRFDLHLMDRLVWHNAAKPPGPIAWASKKRYQLNVAYESVLWFTNDPEHVVADNRRVLEPHTARHARLLAAGGEQRDDENGDGAYRLRPGRSFSRPTPGRIPRNVLSYGSSCADQRAYKRAAEALGLPPHGAPAPVSLGRFLTRWLSRPGDLACDFMAGSFSFCKAAEVEGRRWLGIEQYGEYARGAAERFRACPGFGLNPDLDAILD